MEQRHYNDIPHPFVGNQSRIPYAYSDLSYSSLYSGNQPRIHSYPQPTYGGVNPYGNRNTGFGIHGYDQQFSQTPSLYNPNFTPYHRPYTFQPAPNPYHYQLELAGAHSNFSTTGVFPQGAGARGFIPYNMPSVNSTKMGESYGRREYSPSSMPFQQQQQGLCFNTSNSSIMDGLDKNNITKGKVEYEHKVFDKMPAREFSANSSFSHEKIVDEMLTKKQGKSNRNVNLKLQEKGVLRLEKKFEALSVDCSVSEVTVGINDGEKRPHFDKDEKGFGDESTCFDIEEEAKGKTDEPQGIVPVFMSWSKPSQGCIKINTDGSYTRKSAGFGGIARDDQGSWLGGFYGRLPTRAASCLTPELWAIRGGLNLAKKYNWSSVIIETDSSVALILISEGGVIDSHPDAAVIEECRTLMTELHICLFHIPREGNTCADHLAKLGRMQKEELVILHDPPRSMHQLILADIKTDGPRIRPAFIHWSKPPQGYIKINAHGRYTRKATGFGAIARDAQGRWLGGFYGRLGIKATSSITPKLWAIHGALNLAKNYNWLKVIIEIDSSEPLMLLNGSSVIESHPDRAVIEECRTLISELRILLFHTSKKGNSCAHHLARLGCMKEENLVILHDPPRSIHQLFLADMD